MIMDNKKQELLETAYRLVRTKGFDSFSYNDLSKAVNITKASIHYYFPNKEELGLALCDLIRHRLDSLKASIEKQSTAQAQLDLYIRSILAQAEEDLICPISSLQAEYNVIPDSMKNKLKEITQTELALVANILQRGQEENAFHFDGDVVAQANLLVTSIKSATLYSRVLEQDIITGIVDQFSKQIKTK